MPSAEGYDTALADLASARVGGRAIACSDDFFAPMANLVKPDPAIFIPGKFTPRGKWMDGWESRRKRTPGHDWCVVALGVRGSVAGVDVDTSHFSGNQPLYCTIDALDSGGRPTTAAMRREGAPWTRILERANLTAPHTVHCLPDGRIMISMLGDREGNGPGGFLLLDQDFDIVGRWEQNQEGMRFN